MLVIVFLHIFSLYSGVVLHKVTFLSRLFDVLNSKSFGKGYKAPLNMSNKRVWQSSFDESSELLKNLKFVNKRSGKTVSLLHSQKGTCAKGLLITISSVDGMFQEYIEKQKLLTYAFELLCTAICELFLEVTE